MLGAAYLLHDADDVLLNALEGSLLEVGPEFLRAHLVADHLEPDVDVDHASSVKSVAEVGVNASGGGAGRITAAASRIAAAIAAGGADRPIARLLGVRICRSCLQRRRAYFGCAVNAHLLQRAR